jgi:hypothetical protein
MSLKTFRMEVIAYGERNQVIENCRNCLMNNEADIIDFKMFSDLLINFNIEIPENKIIKLKNALDEINWKTKLNLNEKLINHSSISKLLGTMAVTFADGFGKRKNLILSIPG